MPIGAATEAHERLLTSDSLHTATFLHWYSAQDAASVCSSQDTRMNAMPEAAAPAVADAVNSQPLFADPE